MLIGIPKEIKNNENRVALTPAGVQSLVAKVMKSSLKPMQVLDLALLMQTTKNKVPKLLQLLQKHGQLSS